MIRKLLSLFYLLVFVVVAILFATAFYLNERHYQSSKATLRASFQEQVGNEVNELWRTWEGVEQDLFARFTPADRVAVECMEHDLLQITPDRVVPAYVVQARAHVPPYEAAEAFTKGKEALSLGDEINARAFFEVAGQSEVTNADELYRKVAAKINLIDLAPQPEVSDILHVLALIYHAPAHRLSEAQATFFDEWLAERVQDYPAYRDRSQELWERAEAFERVYQSGLARPRMAFMDRMSSWNMDGALVLDHKTWSERWQPRPPVQIARELPPEGSLHVQQLDVHPTHYVWLTESVLVQAQAHALSQYRMGKLILGLLMGVSVLLAVGIGLARRKERQLEALRSEFISTVSHELRTPLASIRLHAETLYHDRIKPEKRKEYHQMILVEAERLGALVNNVLDFSRLSRNAYQVKLEETDVSTLCEQIAESFQFRLEKEAFQFSLDITPGLMAEVDPLALSQVLFNLLDNAVKYSQEVKEIHLCVREESGEVVIEVTDRGIGIPDALKPRIFDEFVRGSNQRVTSQRGSGIGLHVARANVLAMHGRIDVEDGPNGGSVFVVHLPGMIKKS